MNRLVCIIAALSLPALAGAARLQTIDLRTIECEITSISADTVTIETSAGQETLPREDVAEIIAWPENYDPQADPMALRGVAAMVTVSGDVLPVSVGGLADGVLSFRNSVTGEHQVAMEKISAIYMPTDSQQAHEIAATCREMEMDSGTSDRLLVSQADGGYLSVQGALRTITKQASAAGRKKPQETITFTWQNTDRKMPVADVRAILLADVGTEDTPLTGHMIGHDGTTIGFTAISLEGDTATVESPSLGTLVLQRAHVKAIKFISARVVDLAELEPSAVASHGMVTDAMAYRRNRSVGGGPIVLDGVTYAKGLGLHSFTELTYDIDGEFSSLVAIVGIDDSVRPNGDATLTILAVSEDGRPPLVLTLTGEGSAETIRYDLTGVTQLTIRVDFGTDELGVADHVDLALARLIK